jgi:hypothetical protein
MSLSKFLSLKDVHSFLKQNLEKPSMIKGVELKVPLASPRPAIIGTAFDYLLRFYIKYSIPSAIENLWHAEWALSSPLSPLLKDSIYDIETGKFDKTPNTKQFITAQRYLAVAKKEYSKYIKSGNLTHDLISSTIFLAQLEDIYRSGYIDLEVAESHEQDILELSALISNVNPDLGKSKSIVLLNPTFGKGSELVQGADADLFIDSTLIDIKTTKNFELPLGYYLQLISYAILHEIGSIGEQNPKVKIDKIGIYYSRFGYLFSLHLNDLLSQSELNDFSIWFRKRAEQEYKKK